MKKKIILLSAIFILTGCDINYNLVIDEQNFKESITIVEEEPTKWNSSIVDGSNDTYKDEIDWMLKYPIHVSKTANIDPYDDTMMTSGVKYYQKEKINSKEEYGVSLNTTGHLQELNDFRSLNYCYEFANIINNDYEYIISTSFKNHCFETYLLLDKVNINITTDMKVTSNNADHVRGNTYTWTITRGNYNNKSISLAMQSINEYKQDKNKEEIDDKIEKDNKKKSQENDYIMYIFYGILLLIVVIGYFIIKKIKNKNENFDIDD